MASGSSASLRRGPCAGSVAVLLSQAVRTGADVTWPPEVCEQTLSWPTDEYEDTWRGIVCVCRPYVIYIIHLLNRGHLIFGPLCNDAGSMGLQRVTYGIDGTRLQQLSRVRPDSACEAARSGGRAAGRRRLGGASRRFLGWMAPLTTCLSRHVAYGRLLAAPDTTGCFSSTPGTTRRRFSPSQPAPWPSCLAAGPNRTSRHQEPCHVRRAPCA